VTLTKISHQAKEYQAALEASVRNELETEALVLTIRPLLAKEVQVDSVLVDTAVTILQALSE